jgi:hypothetical protein
MMCQANSPVAGGDDVIVEPREPDVTNSVCGPALIGSYYLLIVPIPAKKNSEFSIRE